LRGKICGVSVHNVSFPTDFSSAGDGKIATLHQLRPEADGGLTLCPWRGSVYTKFRTVTGESVADTKTERDSKSFCGDIGFGGSQYASAYQQPEPQTQTSCSDAPRGSRWSLIASTAELTCCDCSMTLQLCLQQGLRSLNQVLETDLSMSRVTRPIDCA
ncbi:hypothetical protein CLAIMM_08225, partial [Cladophialophora immunda]